MSAGRAGSTCTLAPAPRALSVSFGYDLAGLWRVWKLAMQARGFRTFPGLVQTSLRFKRPGKVIDPGRHVLLEEVTLSRESRSVGAAQDQMAHDIAQGREVIFGFADAQATVKAELGQIAAQINQRLFHEESGQVRRAVKHDLGAADAQKKPRVFLLGGYRIGVRRGIGEHLPGLPQRVRSVCAIRGVAMKGFEEGGIGGAGKEP